MTREISQNFATRKNELHSDYAWLELWDVQLNDTEAIYIVNHSTSVTFNSKTYQPFPIGRLERSEDSEGTIPELSITVTNVDRVITEYLEAGDLLNRTVNMWLVNSNHLSTSHALFYTYKIQNATMNEESVTFILGQRNLLLHTFPKNRFIRTRCRWVFSNDGSTECGYLGSLTTCDYTLSGANGCEVHGDDEVTNGRQRLHPQRFGGFPSIVKGPII